jgi:hypothetical protein
LVSLESNNPLPDRKLARDNWEAFVLDIAAGKIDREENHHASAQLAKIAQEVDGEALKITRG